MKKFIIEYIVGIYEDLKMKKNEEKKKEKEKRKIIKGMDFGKLEKMVGKWKKVENGGKDVDKGKEG